MRRSLFPSLLALGAVLFLTAGARADDTVQAILEKAIKAQGGMEKLAKPRASHSKIKGTVEAMGLTITITGENYVQSPGRIKTVMDFEVNNMKGGIVQVFGKDGAWVQVNFGGNSQTIDLKKDFGDAIKDALYAERVRQLVPLVKNKDKEFELSPLGEAKVNDKPAVGVHVESKGHKPVNLFFDKESGLLVKTEGRAMGIDQQESNQETILSDYKAVDGVKVPMKTVVLHDGKKVTEIEVTEVEFLDKLDDSEFAKP